MARMGKYSYSSFSGNVLLGYDFLAVVDVDARFKIIQVIDAVCHLDAVNIINGMDATIVSCSWMGDIVCFIHNGANHKTVVAAISGIQPRKYPPLV